MIASNHPIRRFAGTIIFVVVLLIIQPFLWRLVTFVADQYHGKLTEEGQYENVQSRLITIETSSESDEALLRQLDPVFPRSTSASKPVERLEGLADESGVVLDIISISDTDENIAGKKIPGIVKLKITAQALGDAASLLEYLEAVEHTDELVTVDSWGLRLADTTQGVNSPLQQYSLLAEFSFYLQTN